MKKFIVLVMFLVSVVCFGDQGYLVDVTNPVGGGIGHIVGVLNDVDNLETKTIFIQLKNDLDNFDGSVVEYFIKTNLMVNDDSGVTKVEVMKQKKGTYLDKVLLNAFKYVDENGNNKIALVLQTKEGFEGNISYYIRAYEIEKDIISEFDVKDFVIYTSYPNYTKINTEIFEDIIYDLDSSEWMYSNEFGIDKSINVNKINYINNVINSTNGNLNIGDENEIVISGTKVDINKNTNINGTLSLSGQNIEGFIDNVVSTKLSDLGTNEEIDKTSVIDNILSTESDLEINAVGFNSTYNLVLQKKPGNVLIGDLIDDGKNKLQVQGNTKLNGDVRVNLAGYKNFRIGRTNTSNDLTLDGKKGNLLLGGMDGADSEKLQIKGSIYSYDSNQTLADTVSLRIKSSSGGDEERKASNSILMIGKNNFETASIKFHHNQRINNKSDISFWSNRGKNYLEEAMRINEDGNLLIGERLDSYEKVQRLQVNGDTRVDGALIINLDGYKNLKVKRSKNFSDLTLDGKTGNLLLGGMAGEGSEKLQINGSIYSYDSNQTIQDTVSLRIKSSSGGNEDRKASNSILMVGKNNYNSASIKFHHNQGVDNKSDISFWINKGKYYLEEGMRLNESGNLLIGAFEDIKLNNGDTAKLQVDGDAFVKGRLVAKKILVTVTRWADYVFADDYKLRPLEEVEEFIKKNKHLPGVKSEDEIYSNGLSVNDMMKTHMEKIEELTLYAIKANKENKDLKDENEFMKKRVEDLEKQVSFLMQYLNVDKELVK